jgi:Bifunctional DNA primase/polymerase, N-terminal
MSPQPQPNLPSELEAALEYARDGIPVFPCNPLDKKPLTINGFKNATVDENQIREWWTKWPNSMIAAPTGPASGMWVVDVDQDSGRSIDGTKTLTDLIAQYGELSKTLMTITPRGGRHLIFIWMNGVEIYNSTGKLGPGVDVRGEGGYVCLPPSRRADGALYQWDPAGADQAIIAPGWLVELARAESKSKRRDKAWARTALERECLAVADAKPGTRNDTLNSSAFSVYQIVAGGKLDAQEAHDRLFEAAERSGLVSDDGAQSVERTIESAAQAARAHPRTRPGTSSATAGAGAQAGTQAQAAPAAQPALARPTIRIIASELPRVINEAEAALIAGGGFDLYQRGGLIVRPVVAKLKAANNRKTFAWRLVPVKSIYMIETMTRAAEFEKWDARARRFILKDCPTQVADAYLAREGHWRLPVLAGIVNTPFLRNDGSLCEQPGYDVASELLFEPNGQSFPTITPNPTREEADAALQYLERVIKAFPFVHDVDHSVALSAILTALDRRAMATAPLHGFSSPVAGTGKSLMVDVASLLATGQIAPVISQGRNEEELEKRLGTALISGDTIISIDNCDHELAGSFLCQALTQQRVKIRLLGYSRQVETPVNAAMFATGNNLTIAGDLVRRTLFCGMDAGCERPELRQFDFNVIETIHADRGRLVAAALTVLRAWHAAGMPAQVKPLGGFEDWARRVREPLIWLGRADPTDSATKIQDNDPARTDLRAVLEQWQLVFGIRRVTIQQIISAGLVNSDLQNALISVAANKGGLLISPERLGRWLMKVEGKIVNKLRFMRRGNDHGHWLWKLQIV